MKWRRISAVLCVAAAICAVFASSALATKYVALGDSYSSGVGTRTFYEETCKRSVYSYPYLLHNAHPEWTFVNATCTGAKTGDILNTQANSLTSDTNWVTYTTKLFNGEDCNALTWFSPSEETRLNETAVMLKNAESAAATRAGSNFIFRDVIPSFIGHAVCDGGGGSSTEWINGLSSPTEESYHPKVAGHANGYYPVVHGVTG